ncbi:hypothetical protein ACHAWO_001100 [Cyclotella atomus]|uniref:Uncharacterized protein n=1 Tax=Cyclotella atomus TaxID=382360 RepID=A0ABD3PKR4_9STRA
MFNPKIIALPLSGLCSIAAALIYTVYLAARTSPSDQPASSRTDYIPIAYIAVSSMLVYYIFLMCQSAVSFYEFFKAEHEYYNKKKGGVKPSVIKIKYGSENFNVLAANRTVANYSEQIIPFLGNNFGLDVAGLSIVLSFGVHERTSNFVLVNFACVYMCLDDAGGDCDDNFESSLVKVDS